MSKFNIFLPLLRKRFLEKAHIASFLPLFLSPFLLSFTGASHWKSLPNYLFIQVCATNPCQGSLGKDWCFQSPNFQGGPLQNRETNLNLTLSSSFILWPCTADPMNRTLSSLCRLNNWTFSGSVDLYNEISTPICVHNAPMPARNGCNIDAFQCRSHHSQSRVQ